MHTVRNRLASRPPAATPIAAGKRVPNHASTRHELALIQRGSMAAVPDLQGEGGLAPDRLQKRRNAKGKKARKAAARMAAKREAGGLSAEALEGAEAPRRAARAGKKGRIKAAGAQRVGGQAVPGQSVPDQSVPDQSLAGQFLAGQSLAGQSASPSAKGEVVQPEQLPAIAPAVPVLGTYAPAPQKIAPHSAPAFALPVRPEPLVEPELPLPPQALAFDPLPDFREPEPELAAAMESLPLPRARALVPARRQGLVDVIAFLLRDSGRRLARWSARRQQSRADRDALRRAQAQQINLQRELEALDALRRNQG